MASTTTPARSLSDDALLLSLAAVLRDSRRTEVDLLEHIAEVDRRQLYLREACSSMFVYCVERLHLSEPETALRIQAARAARRHPACDHERPGEEAPPAESPLEREFTTLAEALESGLELVDIREAWERAHDPPGLQIPAHLPLSEIVSGRTEFPADGRYLIICAHGVRSLSLTEHLRSLGQAEVYSLRGGLAALRS